MVVPIALVAIAIFLYMKNHFENKRDEKRYAKMEHQQESLERLLKTIRKKESDQSNGTSEASATEPNKE